MALIFAVLGEIEPTNLQNLAAGYFNFVSLILENHYESKKPLPLDLDPQAFEYDTSSNWTFTNALQEALELVFSVATLRMSPLLWLG